MLVKEGKSVFNGVAIGKIFVYRKADKAVSQNQVEDTAAEMARFEAAKEKAMSQLKGLYEKALKDVGEEEAMIFDVHQMLLDDLDYNEVKSLRIEAKQKLTEMRPSSIGQASRISGVSPADISVLLVYLESR